MALVQASAATLLIVLTLLLQCAGMAGLIHWGRAHFAQVMYRLGPLRSAVLMARFTSAIVVLHGLQILLWAGFFRRKCFSSWESAFYFSAANYSTVGASDLVLPEAWRVLGAVESVTGVLMCGLSVSLLFAIVTRLIGHEARFSPEMAARLETGHPEGIIERGFEPTSREIKV